MKQEFTDEYKRLTISRLRKANGWKLLLRHLANPERTGELWKAKRESIRQLLGTGMLIALVGDRGRGKTQMGLDLMLAVTSNLEAAEYSTVTGFLLEIKASYHKESPETELDVFNDFCRPKLLVLDEFEKRGDSDWENRVLFEVLNRRYSTMLDTLLLSNLPKAEFLTMIGPSLRSRMQETGGIIECNWPSFRV